MKKIFAIFVAMVCFMAVTQKAFCEEILSDGKRYVLQKMVSQYHTSFNPASKSRVSNIKVARKAINGVLVVPGKVISFNDLVGPRTEEKGFVEAGSYANGKKVTSIGGGICQLASTLSAATINLKLHVVERHRHSLPVSYIPSEMEATVAYGSKDFKFKNTSQNILFIKCFIKNDNHLYVEYWRCKEV